jgi:hypothetical protein
MSRRSIGFARRRRASRRGFALVAALALLALAAALLVCAFGIATARVRSVYSERATLDVEAHSRHALATVLAEWGDELDTLSVGRGLERELTSSERGERASGPPASGRLRVQRLAPGLYAVVVDVRLGVAPVQARQRLRLLVTRPELPAAVENDAALTADSGSVVARRRGAPAPIARWSAADLY